MPTLHHIPVCPFSQRLEILLALKGAPADAIEFRVVDITCPRSPELLDLTRGSTPLPILVTDDGTVLRESLVLMRYLDSVVPGRRIASDDAKRHAIESLVASAEAAFGNQGYRFVMNTDRGQRDAHVRAMEDEYARVNLLLEQYASGDGPFLFDDFGWAETVFTPLFQRFWFLEYYEGFELPASERFARVRRWRDACLAHPAAQQVRYDQIVKLYHDYARGAGNGALLPGRRRSSFVFEPDWRARPWPPRDKYAQTGPSDAALGLLT
jgi:glutathione S-transferase